MAIKYRKIFGFVIVASLLLSMMPRYGFAQPEKTEYPEEYPMETILGQARSLENIWIETLGVCHFEENGIELYYSWRDYKYDIKENAIWLPEREDYPLKEYMRDRDNLDKISPDITESEGVGMTIELILKPEGNKEYAAEGYYVIGAREKEDKVFEGRKALEKREEKYTHKISETPTEVSYYRLLGNPWEYDGKRVKVVGKIEPEDVFEPSGDPGSFTFLLDRQYLEWAPSQKMIMKSWRSQIAADYGLECYEDLFYIVWSNSKRIPIYLDAIFYLYEDDPQSGLAKGTLTNVDPAFEGYVVGIPEKDREKFEKAKKEYYAEKNGYTGGGKTDGK